MSHPPRIFALFRVAAGPRLGHGHLRRAEVLAETLGRPAVVSVRGTGAATWLPVAPEASPGALLDAVAPVVLVIDDPRARQAARWCRAARRRRIPVVSLHDLGIARIASTLAIDGSIASPARGWPARAVVRGPAYAIVRRPAPRRRPGGAVRRILISMGGGPRRHLLRSLASAVARRWPHLEVLVATSRPVALDHPGRLQTVVTTRGLTPVLARVDLAILAGGISLYESVAAGVPTVALAVVAAQRPTIRGFAREGLVVDAGTASAALPAVARRVCARLQRVLDDPRWRRRVCRSGPRLIDGRGVERVAQAIVRVAETADA